MLFINNLHNTSTKQSVFLKELKNITLKTGVIMEVFEEQILFFENIKPDPDGEYVVHYKPKTTTIWALEYKQDKDRKNDQ